MQSTTVATQQEEPEHLSARSQLIDIIVDKGYSPDVVQIPTGSRICLRFFSKISTGPLSTVVLPTLDRKIKLTQERPVTVDLGVLAPGIYPFTCKLDHCCGWLVVTR